MRWVRDCLNACRKKTAFPASERGISEIRAERTGDDDYRTPHFTAIYALFKGDSMTGKTVLSIGQCRPDQAAISHYLTSHFGATVLTAELPADAWQLLKSRTVDLILINRKLDADYSDGMEILQQILADKTTAALPVMLVSNFAEWQEKAVALGAAYGFGKAELNHPETKQRLSAVLE